MRTRSLLVAAVAAAMLSSARADCQPARFGVYLGSSIATLSEQGDAAFTSDVFELEKERRIGFQGGLWLNKPLGGSLSLQPELHFTQKGVGFSGRLDEPGGSPEQAEVSFNLSYLELPLLLRAELGPRDGGVRPFVLAGPVVSYQLSCSFDADVAGISLSRDCNDDLGIGDQINTLDFGATVGGGLAFRVSGRDVTAGLRYTHGLRSLAKETDSVTNRNVSILFGIGF